MKVFVFLLLLANLLLYAFSAGYLGHPDSPDAGRLDQQVAPERMRVVSRGEAPAAKAPAPAPVVVPAPVENVCLRWEHLAPAEADQLTALLGEKFAGFKASRHPETAEGATWWVYIPALPGKAEADKKAGELRLFGVTDYFIVQEAGPNRFAISLGIFSSEKGAQERLADLKAKGIKSARLAPRPGKDSQFAVDASGPAPDKAALLEAATAMLPKAPAQGCP